MKYVSNFYRYGEFLEMTDNLKPVRIVDAMAVGRPKPSFGFFIKQPERLFIVSSPQGPVLGWQDKVYRVTPKTVFRLTNETGERTLQVNFESGNSIKIPAPESNFVDPNFHEDETDMTDFFVWLEHRVPMPHVMASFTEPK
jgi:hypothetical protein